MLYTITYIEQGTEEVKTVKREVTRKDDITNWLNAAANLNARVFLQIENEKKEILKGAIDKEAWSLWSKGE